MPGNQNSGRKKKNSQNRGGDQNFKTMKEEGREEELRNIASKGGSASGDNNSGQSTNQYSRTAEEDFDLEE